MAQAQTAVGTAVKAVMLKSGGRLGCRDNLLASWPLPKFQNVSGENMKAVLSHTINDITVAISSSQQNIYWWIHTCQNLGVKKAEIHEEVLSLLPGAF